MFKHALKKKKEDFVDCRSVIKKNIISNVFALLVSGHILLMFRYVAIGRAC